MHYMIDSNGIQVDLRDESEPMILVEDEWVIDSQDVPDETITERDMHPAHWEGAEGYEPTQDDHDQAELMYVDLAERDLG